jgi:hypothetical protein
MIAPAFASVFIGLLNFIAGFVMIISWLLGFVLAKGFWSTLACTFPLYAWYLVVEFFFHRFMQ